VIPERWNGRAWGFTFPTSRTRWGAIEAHHHEMRAEFTPPGEPKNPKKLFTDAVEDPVRAHLQ
jgi:hypothetical protein